MKNKGKRFLSLLLALLMLVGLTMPTQILSPRVKAAAGQVPAHGKYATDNGDGTTKLELSVTGDADYEADPIKANVIIVLDTSGSMDFLIPSTTGSRGSNATDGDTRDDNFQLYKRTGSGWNATYTPITDAEEYTGTVYYENDWGRHYEYTGTRYSATSRMDATKTSVNNLIDTLATQNVGSHTDTIEMALITFASSGSYNTPNSAQANNWVSGNGQSLKTTVSNLDANGGTNWDDALYRANALATAKANAQPNEKVYIVFFSDGEPTFSNSNSNSDSPTNHTHQNNNNNGSGGTSTEAREYNSAYYHARQIKNASYDSAFYGIFAFGTEESYMKNTVSYGNYGDATHAGSVEGEFYFNANSEDDIEEAFGKIAQSIVNAVGITAVSITDGTTNKVTTSTGVAELLEVDESSYEYWLSWNVSAGTNKFSSFIDGQVVECTVTESGNNIVITWGTGADAGTATYEGTKTGNVIKVKWTGKTDFYNYDPPAATFDEDTGAVDWKLNAVGTLLDGVTYSVTFDVYPSQEALDYVADIKNDPGADGAWGDLDPAIQQYVTVDGNIKTNTTATLTYSDTRLDNPGPKTSGFTNPDPVEAQAVEQVAVTKEWETPYDGATLEPIKLVVTRDGEDAYEVTLSPSDPSKSVHISIGIMDANGTPRAGAEGHDFTFREVETGEYHWQIDIPTVHPMMINGVPTMLIKEDAKHPVPSGADTYTIKGATYYVDQEAVALTATNERRSSLNFTKAVDGDDAPADAVFPFTFHVKDSLAPATAPSASEDPGHNTDYWIWFSVRDKDGNRITEGVGGATHDSGGWWYAPNDTDVTIPVKAGYSIRINNLPTGSTYTITEGTLPTGFIFGNSKIEFTQGTQPTPDWAFTGAQTSTGSIDSTNAVYTVTYTNKYELNDIIVYKNWDDASNQDGKRPGNLTLTLNGAPSGTTVPNPEIVESEDGNTWTYTWEDLPRYDGQGKEINYTVTEGTVPQYYTCQTTTVNDGGTITNVHTPEVTSVTVTKVWDDDNNIGNIRPTSIQVQLKAGDTASGDPVTLNAGNEWTYTWENLPKYANGQEIVYTADETAEPTGYTKSGPETGEDGTITITNEYTPKSTTITLGASKTLSAAEGLTPPDVSGEYTLAITETTTGVETPYTDSKTNPDGNGTKVDFTEITYTKPGTYTYTVTESGTVAGVTNGTTSYDVTVTVTDNGDGTLSAAVTSGSQVTAFTNTYSASGTLDTSTTAILNKTVTADGTEWAPKTFEFKIEAVDGAPLGKDAEGKEVTSGTATFNKAETQAIDFGKITYTKTGTYKYKVKETTESGNGWVCDNTEYEVTVTVEDNGNGTLTATPSAVSITNIYAADGTVVLQAKKELTGRDWLEGESFTFALKDAEGNTIEEKTVTKGNETAIFSPIQYTAKDGGKTYTYTIAETGELPFHVTKSDDIKVKVAVEDKGNGELIATPTYSANTITNTYTVEKKILTVTKIWKDAGNQDGKRPDSVTFTITGSDGKTYTATLSSDDHTSTAQAQVEN